MYLCLNPEGTPSAADEIFELSIYLATVDLIMDAYSFVINANISKGSN